MSLPPVEDAAPRLWPEVLDESGPAIPFDPAQAQEVDQLLDLASPGSPSLPPSTVLDPARPLTPPSVLDTTPDAGPAKKKGSGGCAGGEAGGPFVLLAIALLLALGRSRPTSSCLS
jgi:hypothetical protein